MYEYGQGTVFTKVDSCGKIAAETGRDGFAAEPAVT